MRKEKACLCGKIQVWERKNEGRAYCRGCFIKQMESIVKHQIRRSGVCKGDRLILVCHGDAPSKMMQKIFDKALGKNPGINIIERKIKKSKIDLELKKLSKNPGITKVCLPETTDDIASGLLRQISSGKFSFGRENEKILMPMSRIQKDEAELYCRIRGIRHSKSPKEDDFDLLIKSMDMEHPGLKNQVTRFYEKICS